MALACAKMFDRRPKLTEQQISKRKNMPDLKLNLLGVLVLSTAACFAQVTSPPKSHGRDNDKKAASNSSVSRGQQVFMQNCSRCHNAPEKIPSQSVGTVAKHMRVRAKLSGDDYRALLQFLEK